MYIRNSFILPRRTRSIIRTFAANILVFPIGVSISSCSGTYPDGESLIIDMHQQISFPRSVADENWRDKMKLVFKFAIGITLVLLSVVFVYAGIPKYAKPAKGPVWKQLEELRLKYPVPDGISDYGGYSFMPQQLEKDKDAISGILAFASNNKKNSHILSDELFKRLDEYCNHYNADTVIDPVTAKKTMWLTAELPDRGLPLYSYLLLELAKQRKSDSYTKQCLSEIMKVQVSSLSYEQKLHSSQIHVQKSWVNKKESVDFTNIFPANRDITWCFDSFMKDSYISNAYPVFSPSHKLLMKYCNWRKSEISSQRLKDSLASKHQPQIVAYVDKFMGTLK